MRYVDPVPAGDAVLFPGKIQLMHGCIAPAAARATFSATIARSDTARGKEYEYWFAVPTH